MGAVLDAYPAVEAGGAVREAVSAAVSTEVAAPWWAKVLVGFLLIVIGAVLCWMVRAGILPTFGHETTVALILGVLMLVGAGVMLWGVGVIT
ncbi:MAG TPA: hypothetical protein VFO38_03025 [Candidatus Saccharimonadales bacterium]|nr:hypothetical protein [Candidatus Saccharimonadales bacterium]